MLWLTSTLPVLPPRKTLKNLFGERFSPDITGDRIVLRDAEGKTRVRLKWQNGYIGLEGLRGYEKSLLKAESLLLKSGFAARMPPFDEVRAFAGEKTRESFTRMALGLLMIMEANEGGVIADLDIEFLHDFRVALRRSRSLLSELRGVFSAPVHARWKAAFKPVGAFSGAQRDLDVWLAELSNAGDETLLAKIRADRRIAHDALVKYLQSAAWKNVKKAWRETLQSPPASRRFGSAAQEPIETVASRQLRKQLRRVIKDGRAIAPDSPPESLHKLRIDCKKLRYLLEFFQPLFPQSQTLIAPLKQLQEVLGGHQDACVQLERLGHLTREASLQGTDTQRTLQKLTIGIETSRLRWREGFHDVFARFDRPELSRLFT